MKHFKLFSAVLVAFLISSAAIFNACSKQETEIQTHDLEAVQMTQADINFQNQIVSFKGKLDFMREHPGYKSGEVMSVDSAVWYAEALFNAEYSYADERYSQTVADTTTITVGLDAGGSVSMDDLTMLYNELYEIVRDYYLNCGFSDKGFLLLDLEVLAVSGNEALITVRSVTGEKAPGSFNWDYFGEDDDWIYGGYEGKCGGGFYGFDAAEKIEIAIMENRPCYLTPPGFQWVFSDYYTQQVYGFEYKNEFDECLVFYIAKPGGIFTDDDICLTTEVASSQDEMNFHFGGEMEIIYTILEPELDKRFMDCNIEGKQDFELGTNCPRIRHHNELTFATAHLLPIGIHCIEKKAIE